MHKNNEHWIAMCDLFGGLTAFFIFAAVGVSLVAGHALSNIEQSLHASSNSSSPMTQPKGTVAMLEDGSFDVRYKRNMENGEYLPADMEQATSACKKIPALFKELEATHVAFIGHASCKLAKGLGAPQATTPEYDEFCKTYSKHFAINARFSALRALEMFHFCLECDETKEWFEAHRDRIIIEGRSELEAGLDMNDGVPYCLNRQLPNEMEARYRRVDIQFLKKAPSQTAAKPAFNN